MSHHLDSPASRRDPRLNVTDTYVFDGTAGTVLVMAVNTSLAGADAIGGFHPEARYEFRVHLDGDPIESLTYRVTFGDVGPDGDQEVALSRVVGADARGDDGDGVLIGRGRTDQVIEGVAGDGLRAWAGSAADPFYLDLRHLSFIIEGIQGMAPIVFTDWSEREAVSSFTGSSIEAIVLEIPYTDPLLTSGRHIDVWTTTKLATDAGGWRQINRAAIPMMWPLFRAIGAAEDESYARDSAAHPSDDLVNDGARVTELITAACRITGTTNPNAYADSVVRRLLPDVLPYTIGSPASFGFAGFNGRTLGDNAPEVMYSLVTNTGFPTGLRSASAPKTRSDKFPHVVAFPRSAS